MLTSLAPEVLGSDVLRGFERTVHATIRGVLERYADELRPRNLDIATFIVASSLESLTHGAVLHHPDLLREPELADEMTELLFRYLER